MKAKTLEKFIIKDCERDRSKRVISFSQWHKFHTCPRSWELTYIHKAAPRRESIHVVFGSALHETMQLYIRTMYEKSAKAADELNLHQILRDAMAKEYRERAERFGHFSNKHELAEFWNDGMCILEWFKRRRSQYFKKRGSKLLGIELPIFTQASELNENVYWLGYIDLIIYDEDLKTIYIYDIKTSTRGWRPEDKKDRLKTAQLVSYREYFAKQYKCSVENVVCEFFIVRRKINEESEFPMKRIQQFRSPIGPRITKQFYDRVDEFVSTAFLPDGSYNKDVEYPAIAGEKFKNCRFCEFNDREDLCPKLKRKLS